MGLQWGALTFYTLPSPTVDFPNFLLMTQSAIVQTPSPSYFSFSFCISMPR
ncbi:hypothetical protein RchiOBHm_Chr6g0252331 [Rosa chinensis]|uniref:Uncharacterized protein n=1 Tax=Rosa chinensis TaxID=74649 RepID=A0A2P6PL15_ROSCH|nr:hypothetical protein RchiOBHm_Chr6g0252331 [Rosa chinensis]